MDVSRTCPGSEGEEEEGARLLQLPAELAQHLVEARPRRLQLRLVARQAKLVAVREGEAQVGGVGGDKVRLVRGRGARLEPRVERREHRERRLDAARLAGVRLLKVAAVGL